MYCTETSGQTQGNELDRVDALRRHLNLALRGKPDVVELALLCLLANVINRFYGAILGLIRQFVADIVKNEDRSPERVIEKFQGRLRASNPAKGYFEQHRVGRQV